MSNEGTRGKVFPGTLAVARSVGQLVYDTATSLYWYSTNASTVSYRQVGNVLQNEVADPGTGAAIPVDNSGHVPIDIGAGAGTNTLAIPTFIGQKLLLFATTDGGGSRAITAASAINQGGNTVMTFADVGDTIQLVGIDIGGTLAWRVNFNDGVVLS